MVEEISEYHQYFILLYGKNLTTGQVFELSSKVTMFLLMSRLFGNLQGLKPLHNIMNRRHFLFLCTALTVGALIPNSARAQTGERATGSFIALPQGRKILLLKPSGEVIREIEPAIPPEATIKSLSASQNGELLCFHVGEGWLGSDNMAIYVMKSDGSELRIIKPQSKQTFYAPSLSPDGTRISCRPYAEKATLNVMNLDGKLLDLGASTLGAGESHFSHNGQSIFFISKAQLFRVAAAGGQGQYVKRGFYAAPFDVNQEDTGIAVTRTSSDFTIIAKVTPTGEVTDLQDLPPATYSGVAWSPSGKEIVFTRYRSTVEANDGGLFIMALDDMKPRRISENWADIRSIVWR
jgi:hypothetical protein